MGDAWGPRRLARRQLSGCSAGPWAAVWSLGGEGGMHRGTGVTPRLCAARDAARQRPPQTPGAEAWGWVSHR